MFSAAAGRTSGATETPAVLDSTANSTETSGATWPIGSMPPEVSPHLAQQSATSVQRADESGPTSTAPSPGAEAPAAAATAAAAAPTAGKAAAPDLDELARRLYGPVSALLRAELWLDRERSGRSLAR